MLTQETNHGAGHRAAPKYNDAEIVSQLISTKFWISVFQKGGFIYLFSSIVKFILYGFAFSLSTIFRYQFGVRTIGLLFYLGSLCLMIAFNSTTVHILFKPFFAFAAPILPFVMDTESMLNLVLVELHSQFLLYFLYVVAFFGLVNVLTLVSGFGNKTDATKRGSSYLYQWFFRGSQHIQESMVQGVFEPVLASLMGFACWYLLHDPYAAVYFWVASISLVWTELRDLGLQKRLRYPG